MKYKIVWLLCISIYVWGVEEHSTSFSCKNVQKDSVEAFICGDNNLSKLDNQLNKIYHAFYLLTPELKETQKLWINKRNQCKTKKCIEESYTKRIKTLQDSLLIQKSFPQSMLDIIKSLHKRKQTKADNESPKCMRFFNDLFLFQNIHVVKPILDHVDYNNTKLKKALGSCWDMRMDYISYPSERADNFSLWNSDVNGDKQKEIILGKHKGSHTKIYIVDKALCQYLVSRTSFNLANDIKYVSTVDAHAFGKEQIILEYKERGYEFDVYWYRTPITESIRKNELIMDKGVIGNVRGDGCEYHEH